MRRPQTRTLFLTAETTISYRMDYTEVTAGRGDVNDNDNDSEFV